MMGGYESVDCFIEIADVALALVCCFVTGTLLSCAGFRYISVMFVRSGQCEACQSDWLFPKELHMVFKQPDVFQLIGIF